MKPGWQTTEFWVTLGTTAWALFGHMLPAPAQAVVATVVPAVYTAGRALVKAAAAYKRPPSPAAAIASGLGITGV